MKSKYSSSRVKKWIFVLPKNHDDMGVFIGGMLDELIGIDIGVLFY